MSHSAPSHTTSPEQIRERFARLEKGLNGQAGGFVHARRRRALEVFEELGLPGRRDEDWKYTDVAAFAGVEPWLGAAVAEEGRIDPFLPGWEVNRLVFVNGRYDAAASTVIDEGAFRIASLAEVLADPPEGMGDRFDSLSRSGERAFPALNTAFFADGACLLLERGARLERPLLVEDRAAGLGESGVFFPRHLVVAAGGSAARIVHVPRQGEGEALRAVGVAEIFLGRDARVAWDGVYDGDSEYRWIGALEAVAQTGARFESRHFAMGGALVRNDLNTRFDGGPAEADLRGLYTAGDDELLDFHLLVDHAVPDCESNQLFKGILEGSGKGVFNGRILVRQDAQRTNAYQSNKNLLLSPDAVLDTKPQLEIFADDVRCSHGATSGRLDEDALFYLATRGLPPGRARALLLHAFAGELIDALPGDALRRHLTARVGAKVGAGLD